MLVIGCHADDVEIGCGATLLGLVRERPELEVTWVVLAAAGDRGAKLVRAPRASSRAPPRPTSCSTSSETASCRTEARREGGVRGAEARRARPRVHPYAGTICIRITGSPASSRGTPSAITSILEYEIPKVDGDLGTPNLFVPVSEDLADGENRSSCSTSFATQRDKHWFDADVFLGLMRLRGMECRSPSGYAEAFFARKVPVTLG